jgi:hypothetical protein
MPAISLQEFLWQYRSGRNPYARRDLSAGIPMAMAIMGKNAVAADFCSRSESGTELGRNRVQEWEKPLRY